MEITTLSNSLHTQTTIAQVWSGSSSQNWAYHKSRPTTETQYLIKEAHFFRFPNFRKSQWSLFYQKGSLPHAAITPHLNSNMMFLCSSVVESSFLMEMFTNTKHASFSKNYRLAKADQSCPRLSTFFSVDKVSDQSSQYSQVFRYVWLAYEMFT